MISGPQQRALVIRNAERGELAAERHFRPHSSHQVTDGSKCRFSAAVVRREQFLIQRNIDRLPEDNQAAGQPGDREHDPKDQSDVQMDLDQDFPRSRVDWSHFLFFECTFSRPTSRCSVRQSYSRLVYDQLPSLTQPPEVDIRLTNRLS